MSGIEDPYVRNSFEPGHRLYLKCCGANKKADCEWAPCPANVDCWTGAELLALAAEDEHRVDDAIAIHVAPPA